MTECTQDSFPFATEGRREVIARFDGGAITTEAGGLLLHQTEQKTGILRQFAGCFRDYRDRTRIEHGVEELVRQRVYALAQGYEDLNDHGQLRAEPLLVLLCGKADVEGQQRRREQDRIKEQQLGLFTDRTSTAKMRSNQIRLYFSSIAYCLMQALRELGLAGTKMAKAQCSTIRVRLLKIGAQVRVTVRKVWIKMATGHPTRDLFAQAYANLQRLQPPRC